MAYDRRALIGVGGWLAFFIITLVLTTVVIAGLTVLTVAKLAEHTPVGMAGAWNAYLVIAGVLDTAKMVGFGYMAWRLNARQVASTPPLVIRLLWAVTLLPTIIDAAAGAALIGMWDAAALGASLGRPILYAGVWTAYLINSERVMNTYDDSGEPDRLAAVFE